MMDVACEYWNRKVMLGYRTARKPHPLASGQPEGN